MKKIIALILSLALMLGCAAGLAEAAEKTELGTVDVNGDFKIVGQIPEGYRLSILTQTNTAIVAMLISDDAAKPTVTLSLAFADEWAEIEKLNDVTAEDLAAIEATFQEDDAVNITYQESGHGTKLMVVTEVSEEPDFADIYTIYKGYELEFVMTPGSEPLTEENIQMLIDFMTEIEFIEA